MKLVTNSRGKFFSAAVFFFALLALSTPARADVTVNSNSINFGSQAVGDRSAPVAVTLTNTGRRSVRITRVSLSSSQFRYRGPEAPFYLRPSQVLRVSVTFRPTSARNFTGALRFSRSNAEAITVALAGTGDGAAPEMLPPSFTTHPTSQSITVGQAADFSVTASGPAPMSYQWRKNGADISGATASRLQTAATTSSDNGARFSCVVSNPAGSATSNSATLTVNAAAVAPLITGQPANRTVTAGQTAAFSVTATGAAPLSYQWKRNGANIAGAMSSSYTTPATATSDSGAVFTVAVSNPAGSTNSNPATLTVNAAAVAPLITGQPANRTVTAGQTAAFAVSATGAAPLSYQWRKNGADIAGAMSSSYTTPATASSDTGALFTVLVSNAAGNATSNPATLTVNAATRLLTVNPSSLTFGNVNVDSSSSRNVTFTNTGNSSVTISGVTLAGAGFSPSGLASGQVLAPGQVGTLSVTFSPSATGAVTGGISVSSNATNSPSAVSLSGTGVQQISRRALLTWSPSTSSVVGYHVYSAGVSGGPYSKLTTSPVTTPSHTHSSVLSGSTYFYVVTAINSTSVESVYSNQVSALIP